MNRNDDFLNQALKTEQAGCRKDDTQCCGKCSNSSIENQREKLAFENGMAIEFVNWFFDNKKDGCGNVWFMMMAAMWEGWTAREAQVKQLAAENAALKEFVGECAIAQGEGNWTSDTEKTVYVPASEWIPQTPATDAIIASLRAEGVEMAIEAAKPLIAIEFQYSDFDACVSATYKFPESDLVGKVEMVEWMQDFAAQLRSKSEVQHD